eukprot:gene3769-13832_t
MTDVVMGLDLSNSIMEETGLQNSATPTPNDLELSYTRTEAPPSIVTDEHVTYEASKDAPVREVAAEVVDVEALPPAEADASVVCTEQIRSEADKEDPKPQAREGREGQAASRSSSREPKGRPEHEASREAREVVHHYKFPRPVSEHQAAREGKGVHHHESLRPVSREAPSKHISSRPVSREVPSHHELSKPPSREATVPKEAHHKSSSPVSREGPSQHMSSRPVSREVPSQHMSSRPVSQEVPSSGSHPELSKPSSGEVPSSGSHTELSKPSSREARGHHQSSRPTSREVPAQHEAPKPLSRKARAHPDASKPPSGEARHPAESPKTHSREARGPAEPPKRSSREARGPAESPQPHSREARGPAESPKRSSREARSPAESPKPYSWEARGPAESPQPSSREARGPAESSKPHSREARGPAESPKGASREARRPAESPKRSSREARDPAESPKPQSGEARRPSYSPKPQSREAGDPAESSKPQSREARGGREAGGGAANTNKASGRADGRRRAPNPPADKKPSAPPTANTKTHSASPMRMRKLSPGPQDLPGGGAGPPRGEAPPVSSRSLSSERAGAGVSPGPGRVRTGSPGPGRARAGSPGAGGGQWSVFKYDAKPKKEVTVAGPTDEEKLKRRQWALDKQRRDEAKQTLEEDRTAAEDEKQRQTEEARLEARRVAIRKKISLQENERRAKLAENTAMRNVRPIQIITGEVVVKPGRSRSAGRGQPSPHRDGQLGDRGAPPKRGRKSEGGHAEEGGPRGRSKSRGRPPVAEKPRTQGVAVLGDVVTAITDVLEENDVPQMSSPVTSSTGQGSYGRDLDSSSAVASAPPLGRSPLRITSPTAGSKVHKDGSSPCGGSPAADSLGHGGGHSPNSTRVTPKAGTRPGREVATVAADVADDVAGVADDGADVAEFVGAHESDYESVASYASRSESPNMASVDPVVDGGGVEVGAGGGVDEEWAENIEDDDDDNVFGELAHVALGHEDSFGGPPHGYGESSSLDDLGGLVALGPTGRDGDRGVGLKSSLGAIGGGVGGLESSLGDVGGGVGGHESSLDAVDGGVGGLELSLGDVGGGVGGHESSSDAVGGGVGGLESGADEVGGAQGVFETEDGDDGACDGEYEAGGVDGQATSLAFAEVTADHQALFTNLGDGCMACAPPVLAIPWTDLGDGGMARAPPCAGNTLDRVNMLVIVLIIMGPAMFFTCPPAWVTAV